MSGLYRKWAPPTWIFFHTFAAKINKQFFEANREAMFIYNKIGV